MNLCNRCRVPGCCLDYLGKACESARKEHCPEVKRNRAEIISDMDIDEMAKKLLPVFEELCEDGVPSPEYMRDWLAGEPKEGETLYGRL